MAEGLFRLNELGGLPFSEGKLRSVLRLDTGRSLSYRFFDDDAAAKEWTGFVSAEDGAETFQWGITAALLDDLDPIATLSLPIFRAGGMAFWPLTPKTPINFVRTTLTALGLSSDTPTSGESKKANISWIQASAE